MKLNSLKEKSIELNILIKETSEYKDYINAKKILESNTKLSSIKSNLEKMKHVMCKCDDECIKEEYSKALEEYNASPIVINYNIYESRLNDLISNLIDVINKGL